MGDDAAPDKPLTKRARRTEEMRRRILDASLRLFIQQGYEKTTTRQILNEVGILNGSLYNIYSSKEEIFSDIVMMALEDAIRQTPEFVPADTPPCLKLGFFLNAQIYLSARSPRIAELLMMAYKHWDIHGRATEALRKWLESIDLDNTLRSDSPDFMLRLEACMAMTGTYVERLYREPGSMDPLDAMPLVINTVANIMGLQFKTDREEISRFIEVLGDREYRICGIPLQ